MPFSCVGNGSSIEDDLDGACEFSIDGDDCDGVIMGSLSSSESSSSPMVNVPPSSGTLLNDGVLRTFCGLRIVSKEPLRIDLVGLVKSSVPSAASFLCRCSRSISSRPLSRVNDRKASNRLRALRSVRTKILLPRDRSESQSGSCAGEVTYWSIGVPQ